MSPLKIWSCDSLTDEQTNKSLTRDAGMLKVCGRGLESSISLSFSLANQMRREKLRICSSDIDPREERESRFPQDLRRYVMFLQGGHQIILIAFSLDSPEIEWKMIVELQVSLVVLLCVL